MAQYRDYIEWNTDRRRTQPSGDEGLQMDFAADPEIRERVGEFMSRIVGGATGGPVLKRT